MEVTGAKACVTAVGERGSRRTELGLKSEPWDQSSEGWTRSSEGG